MILVSIENALDIFQEKKRIRIAHIVYELLERDGEADLKEFRGSIDVHWGMKGKTQDEYIEDLKNAGIISIKGKKMFLTWDKDKTEDWLQRQGIIVANR